MMYPGLGAASDDLSAFNNALSAGDQYLASGVTDGNLLSEFTSAVQAYQAGASAAVVSLGPAIDAQTNGASRSLVGQAASVYSTQLSQITNSGSSQADAMNASLFAHQMQALYTTAIALPLVPTTVPPRTVPPATPTLAPTPAPSGSSAVPWILGGAALIGAGVIGWMMFRKPVRRMLRT
jgi:hypothetical protein